ncbi:MAG TPA: MSHA biogenesis protein MshK [Burkholderiales bacterium]|nr:MSHA biogenesis protein MshK [Burkholderiales bacterium]
MSSLPVCLIAGLLACSAPAHGALGQSLADPTRPPNVSGAPGAQGDAEAPSTILQSVLISPGRKLAVINGAVVPLGGKVGEATLTSISESQVVLKFADRIEVVKLLGGIERRPVRGAREKPAR